MITIPQIRESVNKILVLGNHEPIIQSILDFDYLSGKKEGSVAGIVTGRRGFAKYFWGRSEILIPTFAAIPSGSDLCPPGSDLKGCAHPEQSEGRSDPKVIASSLWLLNLLSGRRTLSSTLEFFRGLSSTGDLAEGQVGTAKLGGESSLDVPRYTLAGAALFAENVPELHSLQIINAVQLNPGSELSAIRSKAKDSSEPHAPLIVGPASVGLLVPGMPHHSAGALKLGPIGGITPTQIEESHLTEPGHVAVMSASGGMTNELINIAVGAGHRLSFALSFGGDRFPVLSPREAFLLAESDPETQTVLYYGELGGEDEYELVKLKQEGLFTKPVVAHIAGTVADLFAESPQFGHAKAKADKARVTARAKRAALQAAGFTVSDSFSEFIHRVSKLNV